MVRGEQGTALRHVQMLFEVGTIGSLTDRQLLEQFRSRARRCCRGGFRRAWSNVTARWSSALAGPSCGTSMPSEDAFQATFLVLVRRAGSLWVRDSLGPWLFQVAVRVARSARSARFAAAGCEQQKAERTEISVFDRDCDDLGPAIHQELARLPEQFRAAVVLCCIEGLTQQQAAGQLGWPLGTLQSRLARGRERLRARMIRQGPGPIECSARRAACRPESAQAALPVALANSTVRMAVQYAAGKAGDRRRAPRYRSSCLLKES